jgi:inner membrane protease ATP23
VICEDNLRSSKITTQTLRHELVHAYDQCRAKVNWKSGYHYACTEVNRAKAPAYTSHARPFDQLVACYIQVRASALSGECDWLEEVDRLELRLQGQHQVRPV